MGAAVTALSWELLARSRWLLVLTGGWLVLLCLAGLALPASIRIPEVGVGLAVTLAFPLMFLLGSLSHGEGRLESASSLFPRRLFTLPVPTIVLIGPPLLLTTVVVVASWALSAVCILHAFGANAPLWWPGLFSAGALALLQAASWTPFPLPWLRPVGLAVLGIVLIAGLTLLEPKEVDWKAIEPVLVLASLGVLLTSYLASLVGVARARRGAGERMPFQVGAVAVGARQETPRPFSSPLRAQMSLEAKRLRWGFLLVSLLCLYATLPLMWVIDRAVFAGNGEALPESFPVLRRPLEVLGPSWLVTACLPILPFLILSALGGSELGRLKTSQSGPLCSPFLATRPMRTADMVKAKLVICAVGVLWLWGGMVLAWLGCAAYMGRVGEMADRLVSWTGSGPAAVVALVGGLALLAVVNWLALIRNLWLGAFGRPLVHVAAMVGVGFSPAVVVLVVANWRDEWWKVLGWGMGLALVCKALAAGWVVWRLRRERLLRDRELGCAIAGWVLLAAVVGSAALYFGGLLLAGGALLLLLPLAQPLAGPLALAHNRTR